MSWTEGSIHIAMRSILRGQGWLLVAGEYPGGSDHELWPLNVVDPSVACDRSPNPRGHSVGELIPDLVALRGRELILAEAKVSYSGGDKAKLGLLVGDRRSHLECALQKFASERGFGGLLPVSTLIYRPLLVFRAGAAAPKLTEGYSYLRVENNDSGYFEGVLGGLRH